MAKNMKWVLPGLAILVVLYFLNSFSQSKYTTSSDSIFIMNDSQISQFQIQSGNDRIVLVKSGDNWSIIGHDSLIVRDQRITSFYEQVLNVKRETLVSRNEKKWSTYAVDDSTGTHLFLFNEEGKEISHVIFGRSKSDWSHNYVRESGQAEVYLTDTNIIHILNSSESYWGEKPKPVEPDTTGVIDSTLIPNL